MNETAQAAMQTVHFVQTYKELAMALAIGLGAI
jgi:hypothetical protein